MSNADSSSPWRTELDATLRLAAPLAAANLLQMLVYMMDVAFVARLGPVELAAASLGTTIFGLMMWCFSALTGASSALIGAELGRRAHAVREVRRSARMALWLAVMCGGLGMTVCLSGERILLLTRQDPVVAARAGSFLAILLFAMIPMILSNVLRIVVSALGRPVFATLITVLALVVNFIGNYAFVFGHFGAPALGLEGSALSSVITSLATLAAYGLAIRTDRRIRRYRLFGRWWAADWQRFREIMRIGMPVFLTVLAEGGLFSSAAFLMGLLGTEQLGGHTVALQVAALAFQVPFGIGQAVTIRVGYHYGARDPAGVALAGRAALIMAIGYMVLPAVVMLFAPRAVLSIYLGGEAWGDSAVTRYAIGFLAIAAAFQLFDGVQAVMASALRGLQDTRVPMAMALSGYWLVGFSISVGLGFFTPLGGNGVWIGLAIGLVAVSALLYWRWRNRERLGLVPG